MTMSEEITQLRNLGIHVLPAHKGEKRPNPELVPSWEKYRNIPPTEEDYKMWFPPGYDENIWIILGPVSGNLAVIEFDIPNLAQEIFDDSVIGTSFETLKQTTLVVESGSLQKKYHIYFLTTQPISNYTLQYKDKQQVKHEILSMRFQGQGVIGPGSIHPSGGKYTCVSSTMQIKTIENPIGFLEGVIARIWEIHPELMKRCTTTLKAQPLSNEEKRVLTQIKQTNQSLNAILSSNIRPCLKVEIERMAANKVHSSHQINVAIGLELIANNFTEAGFKTVFSFAHDYDEKMTNDQYRSLSKLDSNNKPHYQPCSCFSLYSYSLCSGDDCPLYLNVILHHFKAHEEEILRYLRGVPAIKNAEGNVIQRAIKPFKSGAYELMGRILNETGLFITIPTLGDGGSIVYCYKNGVWMLGAEAIVQEILVRQMGEFYTINAESEIMHVLRAYSMRRNFLFPSNPNFICFKNGVYKIDSQELLSHEPDYYFRTQIPHDYIQDAQCPRFKDFLASNHPDNEIVQKTLVQMIAWMMIPANIMKTFFVLYGPRDTGKTTFVKLIQAIFEGLCAGVELQKLGDRFEMYNLVGKAVNIYDDLSEKTLYLTGPIKTLTGGVEIYQVETKGKQKLEERIYAKNLFTCNKFPQITDNDDAVLDRLNKIDWIVQFTRDNPKRDESLGEKLKAEIPGIIKLAIDSLPELMKTRHFANYIPIEKARKIYMPLINHVAAWFEETYEITGNTKDIIPKADVFENYISYCANCDNETAKLGMKQLTSRLQEMYPKLRQDHDSKKNFWIGIRVKAVIEAQILEKLPKLFQENQGPVSGKALLEAFPQQSKKEEEEFLDLLKKMSLEGKLLEPGMDGRYAPL